MDICITDSLCCTVEMQYCKSTILQFFFLNSKCPQNCGMGRGIGGHNDKGDKWLKNHQHLHSPPPSLILPACHFPCLSPCGGNQGAGSPISIPHVCYQRGTQTLVQILKSPASVQLRLYQLPWAEKRKFVKTQNL